jgi:hypothetical protein
VVASFCHDATVGVETPWSRGRGGRRGQRVEARSRDQVVEAAGLDQVVEARGLDQVVEAAGLDQVVEVVEAAERMVMAVSLVRREMPISARE